jgi:hypothetical protein
VFAAGNISGETKGTGELLGNLIPVLSRLVIGYPLSPATIRAMLVGWMLVALAITKSILRNYFQTKGSGMALRPAPIRSVVWDRNR